MWRTQAKSVPPDPPADGTAHVTVYATPPVFDSTKIEPAKYKGLLYAEAMGTRDSSGQLVSTWRDKDAFEAAQSRFHADTGLGAHDIVWQGFHIDTLKPRQPFQLLTSTNFWRTVSAVLALILALHTYADNISDGYNWLFAAPDFTVFCEKDENRVSGGGSVDILMLARNNRRIGSASLEFARATVDPPTGLQLETLKEAKHFAIKQESPAKQHLIGKALPVEPGQNPITYTVTLDLKERAGIFAGETADKCTLRILVVGPWTILDRKCTVLANNECRVSFRVQVGPPAPGGLHVDVTTYADGITILDQVEPAPKSREKPLASDPGGQHVAKLSWQTVGLAANETVPFAIVLKHASPTGAASLTADQWESIVKNLDIDIN
jgi:hypothetical protein